MVKWLVLGTLRHLLGLLVILTIAGCTYAATLIPAPAETRYILMAAGFVGGLVISSILFGVVYLLFEIADHTRETAELLRAQQGRRIDMDTDQGSPQRHARRNGERIEPRL